MEEKKTKKVWRSFDWMPSVELKNLGEGVKPRAAHGASIGYDLCAARDTYIKPKSRTIVWTDIAVNLLPCVEGKIEARSGFSAKGMEGYGKRRVWRRLFGILPWLSSRRGMYRYDADVITGKIDPGYHDNIGIIVRSNDREGFVVKAGTRLAQITFYRVVKPRLKFVDELSGEDRGGGFGSTGVK